MPSGTVGPGTASAAVSLVAVVDGGTLRLGDTVVRLEGWRRRTAVAAARTGREAYDCGAGAAAALADLVRGRAVSCQLGGGEAMGLVQGDCEAGGTDLGHALVAAGWARARPEFGGASLGAAEAEARSARRGLWRNGANPGF